MDNSNLPSESVLKVDLTKYSEDDLKVINTHKSKITIDDRNNVLSFGSDVQKNISKFSEKMLTDVQNKDVGFVGESLTNLLSTIKGVDLNKLSKNESVISKIPVIGALFSSAKKSMMKFENVTDTVDSIVVSLDKAKSELMRDINVLDDVYNKNIDYIKDLEILVDAGIIKLNELRETTLIEFKNKAESTKDMLDVQNYNDFNQFLTEVEKRIHDLRLSREIAVQTMPQIRIIQNNNKVLINKVQSSILTTIPIWKNQIVLTLSLHRQKTVLELQKQVSDTTEELLKRNAELLKTNSLEIARESERGVVSIETLRETHKKLLETIEESVKIYEEGKQKRSEVEKELKTFETAQKDKLLSVQGNSQQ